jgi:Ca-activated chloride channel family protein
VTGLEFAEPQWAQLFWALAALLGVLFWLERRGGAQLSRFVSTQLQERLVRMPAQWRRTLRVGLLGVCFAFLILALMRPQWGLRYVTTPRAGAEIMICLDVSKSMLAEDVAPNRLERAKAEITDLLSYLREDKVGLIAFAGRATVLSPLTPDFGFLRLVLDNAGPHSVTRGGTRLEEPLRKALSGFGPAGESSRAILLITDGEDHDSLPLDAAKRAAELGVRIIAIGFGDEAGSEIRLSDPQTGARTLLRDADGQPVRSRLDGDMLRQLALETGGAYVPAGTGLLDLESIYETHISGLIRGQLDGQGRTVREDAFQLALLLALISLIGSVAVSSGSTESRAPLVLLGLLSLGLGSALPARAQDETAAPETEKVPQVEERAQIEDPREIYNRGLDALSAGDLEEADHALRRARSQARDDGELRFRAAYNLGWAAFQNAEQLEAEDPAGAMALFEGAADWFRRAVRARPEGEDARYNLDVTLRRALLLADRIAQASRGDLAKRLAELAGQQRQHLGGVATLLNATGAEEQPVESEAIRRGFKELAIAQRQVLADADLLAEQAGDERDAIDARAEEERGPEDEMRSVQLTNLLHYLHRARARMGQARRQLRQRQGDRAHLRSSAALVELKRALDQLRDPRSVLDAILRDATRIALETATLATARHPLREQEPEAEVPAWITMPYLSESQRWTAERTQELHARLEAGLQAGAPVEADPQTLGIFQVLTEAEPLLKSAQLDLASAADALEAEDLDDALEKQGRGLEALLEARELFLDARGLIETLYADEGRIQSVLSSEEEPEQIPLADFLPALQAAQAKNLSRAERLKGMLEELGTPPEGADEAEREAVAKRQEVAKTLLELATGSMHDVGKALGGPDAPAAVLNRAKAASAADEALEQLGALRRLFFSIAEHLRETAEEQLELADQTRGASGPEALPSPLAPRQGALARRAGAVADALEEQSRQQGGTLAEEPDAEETTRRLRAAGEHVLGAETEMEAATTHLELEPPELEAAVERQDAALQALEQALALLVPPQQQQQPQETPQSGDQQGQQGEQQGEQDATERAEDADPARLLQEVRDREAQRRRERAQRQRAGYEPVEKDW